jgi:hypothetical protein
MPPTPTKETAKKPSGKMYAWTEIRYGGEAEKIPVAGGRSERFVVKSRNVIPLGDEVSQSDIDADDDYWQHLQDEGIVRPYPLPEGTDEYTSPTQAFLGGVSTGTGEVDIDKLMELGLTNPTAGAYVESEEVVTAPSGA